jgi:hypothetical protein
MASGAVTQEPAFTGTMAPVLQTDPAWLWDRCEQLSEKAPICFRAMIARPLFWRGTWRDRGRGSTGRLPISPRRETAPGRSRGPLAAIRLIHGNAGTHAILRTNALRPAISPEWVILVAFSRGWRRPRPAALNVASAGVAATSGVGRAIRSGLGRWTWCRHALRAALTADRGLMTPVARPVGRTGWPTGSCLSPAAAISAATPKRCLLE